MNFTDISTILTGTSLFQSAEMRLPINDMPTAVIFYAFVFIFGVLLGSFANVVILRIPLKQEVVRTPSHCMSCGHKLAWYDNIPLFSWISLGGKCRYCKEKISFQYPAVELASGLLWLIVFFVLGFSPRAFLTGMAATGLLAMSIIDWRTYEIENGFHVFFGMLGLIYLLLSIDRWLSAMIGAFCISVPLYIIFAVSKGRAIGGGDVKLMFACGIFLGAANSVLALIVGCAVGSVVHLIRMRVSGAGKVLAMGPYLAIGILTAALFGDMIIPWYMSLFQA